MAFRDLPEPDLETIDGISLPRIGVRRQPDSEHLNFRADRDKGRSVAPEFSHGRDPSCRVRASTSLALIAQLWLASDFGVDAGDRAQILVDGLEVMVGHVRKRWPWHDLEKIPVDWIVG
jgi:hypothetical protein